ncbi:cation:proton antiporter [Frankia sp. AgB32]|uniref:cation:proton antiporter n=1 Tax=Frankia sp. AgB32 TaxID=631119 RepID=UPI00200E11AB|nr:cation:proton antiporter [Frankia sp. AgB32]MCK9897952.1 cation:proton antiporter [Frankia sp. AgB32]
MSSASNPDHVVAVVFADAALIIVVSTLFARAVRRYRQPVVIGEILAGLALGPSLLGLLPGDLPGRLFPTDVRPHLSVLAQFGLVLFMFVVGFEHDLGHVRRAGRVTAAMSASSIILPFGFGLGAAAALHPWHHSIDGHPVRTLPFLLFLGTALSITALPVLARILVERRMNDSPIGRMSLTCAIIGDAVAWCMLAVVVAIVKSHGPGAFLRMIGELAGLVATLSLVVAPAARAALARVSLRTDERTRTSTILSFVVVGVLLSAWATAEIGLHPVFGAFAFGAVLPRDSVARAAPNLSLDVERLGIILLPLFFVTAGLSVNLRTLGARGLVEILLITAVACGGKAVGAGGAALASGLGRGGSAVFATLMNTRGLTEIVVAQIGLDLKVLDRTTFTALVVMAVFTTAATGPLLNRLASAPWAVAHGWLPSDGAAVGGIPSGRPPLRDAPATIDLLDTPKMDAELDEAVRTIRRADR